MQHPFFLSVFWRSSCSGVALCNSCVCYIPSGEGRWCALLHLEASVFLLEWEGILASGAQSSFGWESKEAFPPTV